MNRAERTGWSRHRRTGCWWVWVCGRLPSHAPVCAELPWWLWALVFTRDGWTCQWCRCQHQAATPDWEPPWRVTLDADHLNPVVTRRVRRHGQPAGAVCSVQPEAQQRGSRRRRRTSALDQLGVCELLIQPDPGDHRRSGRSPAGLVRAMPDRRPDRGCAHRPPALPAGPRSLGRPADPSRSAGGRARAGLALLRSWPRRWSPGRVLRLR